MKKSLFLDIPENTKEEIFEILVETENIKIERIISNGHSSEEDFWYDQDMNEFVVLVSGEAVIEMRNGEEIHLFPGDFTDIKAHEKHRVKWTKKNTDTIWLAVHYS